LDLQLGGRGFRELGNIKGGNGRTPVAKMLPLAVETSWLSSRATAILACQTWGTDMVFEVGRHEMEVIDQEGKKEASRGASIIVSTALKIFDV
jgi:hypothetical protein